MKKEKLEKTKKARVEKWRCKFSKRPWDEREVAGSMKRVQQESVGPLWTRRAAQV